MAEVSQLQARSIDVGADGATVTSAPARRLGRPRGVPNKTTRAAKEAITDAAPWELLVRVMRGQTFKRADEEGARRAVGVRPTLTQSIAAAEALLRKVCPDMKATELSGPGGGPIASETRVEHRETLQEAARAVHAAAMLAARTPPVKP
jgi:hypothetical protein